MRTRERFIWLLAGTFILGYGCLSEAKASQPSKAIQVINSGSNPKIRGEIPSIDLEIEIAATRAGEYFLNRPSQISLDNQGRIYVLDSKESDIKKFDEKGRYIKTIGRPGLGPGELSGLSSIFVFCDQLVAWCSQYNRFVRFDLDGRLITSGSSPVHIIQVRCDSSGRIYGTTANFGETEVLVQLDRDAKFVRVIDRRPLEPPRFASVGLIYALGKNDEIVVGNHKDSADYFIKVFNPIGELTKLIRKEHDPIRIPSGERDFARRNNRLDWEIPDYYMPFSRICVNELGTIITVTYARRDKETGLDFFDSQGQFISKRVLRSFFYYCLWDNGRLYTIEQNEEGYLVPKIYRVTWNR